MFLRKKHYLEHGIDLRSTYEDLLNQEFTAPCLRKESARILATLFFKDIFLLSLLAGNRGGRRKAAESARQN